MIARSDRLAMWEAFRKIPPSAPHGSNHASWLLTNAIAAAGRYKEIHVFLEAENAWPLQLPEHPPTSVLDAMSLPGQSGQYAAIYLSGNHYIVGNKVFTLRPLHDWAPIVCEIGTTHSAHQWSSLFAGAMTGTLRRTDVLILKSEATKRLFEHVWAAWKAEFPHVEEPTWVVLPNGIDTDANRPRADLRHEARRQLELPSDSVVFLAFSRLGQSTKGDQRSLVSLWGRVCERSKNAVLLLSGAGNDAVAMPLRELARSLGIADRVLVRPNPYGVWPDAKERLMSAADAFVHMTTGVEETFPLTTLEGMSYGLPLIATRWAGNTQLVSEGHDGFLVDTVWAPLPAELRVSAFGLKSFHEYFKQVSSNVAHDAKAFIDAVVLLASDEQLRRRMGTAAREKIVTDYGIERAGAARIRVCEAASAAARRCGRPPPRRVLVDAEWIVRSMAARELSPHTQLGLLSGGVPAHLPEASSPTILEALRAIVDRVAALGETSFDALCNAVRPAFERLELVATGDHEAVRVIAYRLVLRLMNYGVVRIVDDST